MRKDDPQVNLRIPPDLKELIQQEAKKNRRTQTAEIIARLQESFEPSEPRDMKLDEETKRELLASLLAEVVEERLAKQMEDREKNKNA